LRPVFCRHGESVRIAVWFIGGRMMARAEGRVERRLTAILAADVGRDKLITRQRGIE